MQMESTRRTPKTENSLLADRNILVDHQKDGIFAAFGDARYKIESGDRRAARCISRRTKRWPRTSDAPACLRSFSRDFFDLVM